MTDLNIAAATAKKAEKNGITLVAVTDATVPHLAATKGERTFRMADISAADFLTAVVSAFAYEDNGFEGIEEDENVVIAQQPTAAEDDAETDMGEFVANLVKGGKAIGVLARDTDLRDLLVSLEDEEEPVSEYAIGLREDAEPDEEEEETGSVVPETFKRRYKEAGHPGHCGDWLAVTLNGLCQTTDGKKTVTDLDRLEAIANANDVAPARVDKLGTATNGWQGRYRMTVRNMLSKKVADKGHLFVPEGCGVNQDTEMQAPKEWCDKFRTAVKKTKTKAAVGEPQELVVSKDEGAGKPSAKTVARNAANEKQMKASKPKQTQAEKLAAAKAKAAK